MRLFYHVRWKLTRISPEVTMQSLIEFTVYSSPFTVG